jgi:rRNA maturation protein Nop10
MKVKDNCWSCGKAVKVPADNNNIYTRICAPCAKAVRSTSPHRASWVR